MERDAMSKLSASLFALVVVLSTLVIPMGGAEADTLGTNTIYVPVSDGSPVSGATVTLTNVHTGNVIQAPMQSPGLYVAQNAPSGYYRVDVVSENHYDKWGAEDFPFEGSSSYTVTPTILLEKFDTKAYLWNVTVRDADGKLTDATVGFYNPLMNEMVAQATTNSQGLATVNMFRVNDAGDFALVVQKTGYEMHYDDTVTVTSDVNTTVVLTDSLRITGFVQGNEGPASNVVAYLLSNDTGLPWIQRLMKSTGGSFFEFDVVPGEYLLCVDADGVSSYTEYIEITTVSVDLSLDSLDDQTQRLQTMSITYGSDFNSFTLTEATVWSYDDAYPGLPYSDVGSLRMQIDLNAVLLDEVSGVVDGVVSGDEAEKFESLVYEHGVKYPATGRFLLVNETHYYVTEGTMSAFTLDMPTGSVINYTGLPYSYSCVYNTPLDGEIDVGAEDYTATVYASYETASVNYTYTVTLPGDYELVDNSSDDPSSHVSVSGFATFTIDSEEYVGGPEPVSLVFELSEKPSAGAGMEIEQGLVYAVTDDGGNITKYIVRVGTEVNFTAMDSLDPNGNPMTYTWDFDDGTAPVTTSEVTVGYNYTSASESRIVNLTVTDAVGIQNWTEIEVMCDALDPVPVISIKDKEVNETTGALMLDQGESMWLNATYSTDDAVSADDSLGVIDFFEFYYGDGNESDRISWTDDEKNVSHAFAESGTYEVVLNVTDVAGHWKNTTLTVNVNDSDAPVVSFTVKNATGGTHLIENATIVFDANATEDNLDSLEDMSFSWYFADDLGEESWLNGTGLINVTHVFKAVGHFSVELNVTDLSNNTGSIKQLVKIESSSRPDVVIDGRIIFDPAEFTEGKAGTISVNLTNKGSAPATGIVVTIFIVYEDSQELLGTTTMIMNGSTPVTELAVGGKAVATFTWTPSSKGTYKIKVNVTSTNQLVTHSLTTKADEDLVVKEAPWKKAALWGGIVAVIVLVPLLLYLRGRWSRRERKGPRRDRDRLDKKSRRERDKQEKRERKEREKEKAREAKEAAKEAKKEKGPE